jgi:5-methylcytosine-specific restriction endonuclease McrA
MKRTPLRAKSKKRQERDQDPEHRQIRERVFARDGYTCQAPKSWGVCYGVLTPHHVVKASQGGDYSETNLVTLCAHHNGLIESDSVIAHDAQEQGLVKKSWES